MDRTYIPPELEVVCFAPIERLSNDEDVVDVLSLDLSKLTRSGNDASRWDDDIFIPFG